MMVKLTILFLQLVADAVFVHIGVLYQIWTPQFFLNNDLHIVLKRGNL